jgi:putative heme iron utilization protein
MKHEVSMSEPITPAISDRICKHMNEDHRDAILLYAQFFGQVSSAEQAVMQAISPQSMKLLVHSQGTSQEIEIPFDHELVDAEDAHQTLIKMVKQARQGLR